MTGAKRTNRSSEPQASATSGPGDGFRALFDRATDLVVVDVSGKVLDANPAALRALGYGPEKLTALHDPSLLSEDQFPRAIRQLSEVVSCGHEVPPTDYRLRAKGGRSLVVEV